MFSIKSLSIVAVGLSALVLSTCSSDQKPSTTPANTTPPSTAQTVAVIYGWSPAVP
jgi:ABC-type glycerol-3-phosphate transport system substrate-binding protein